MLSDTLWVLRSFGFTAGIRFVWDSLKLWMKRFIRREEHIPYSELSESEAEKIEQLFGLPEPEERPDRIVHVFDKTLN